MRFRCIRPSFIDSDWRCGFVQQARPWVFALTVLLQGIAKSGRIETYGEPVNSTLGSIDFAKLAEASGVRITNEQQITEALSAALSQSAVTVTHVPIVGGHP